MTSRSGADTLPTELSGPVPVDLVYVVPPSPEQPGQEPCQYVASLEETMVKIHEIARNHMLKAADEQKREYDLKQYKNNYKKRDLVWLFTPAISRGRVKKLSSRWTGPFQVVEPLPDVVIRIRRFHEQTIWSCIITDRNRTIVRCRETWHPTKFSSP